jgi:hypothetical protein
MSTQPLPAPRWPLNMRPKQHMLGCIIAMDAGSVARATHLRLLPVCAVVAGVSFMEEHVQAACWLSRVSEVPAGHGGSSEKGALIVCGLQHSMIPWCCQHEQSSLSMCAGASMLPDSCCVGCAGLQPAGQRMCSCTPQAADCAASWANFHIVHTPALVVSALGLE